MNFPFNAAKAGTIGQAVHGTELKISTSGELMIRSPGLFKGYIEDPVATAAAFDADGFFRTGDLAFWCDRRKAWVITGRVGEIFKTATGKFVAPLPIESYLLDHVLVEQACVMGPGLDRPVAVVQLVEAAPPGSREAAERDLHALMKQVNVVLESHERLAAIVVSDSEWSVDNGLLTPTLKIRRRRLEQRYLPELQELTAGPVLWLDT